ncbi:unnamed protein product, partial [Mesorhabditis spiculigera]
MAEKTSKKSSCSPNPDDEINISTHFTAYTLKKTFDQLKAEFANVPRDVKKEDMTMFLKNGPKNRSPDVPCVDKERVVLRHAGPHYIHANYVYLFGSTFICAQLPTSETVDDHWLMILQAQCESIVTISDSSESGKITPYWPTRENPVKTFGDFTIRWYFTWNHPSPKLRDSVKLSRYEVSVDGQQLNNIYHYHWTDWPAGGVPRDFAGPIELLKRLSQNSKPILVESLLGVGRPGVLALLQYALNRTTANCFLGFLDEDLHTLRQHRAHLVETPWQYIYVYMALLQHFEQMPGRGFTDARKKKLKEEWMPAYHKFAKEAEAQLKRDAAKKK